MYYRFLLLILSFFFISFFYSAFAQDLDTTMWTTDGEVLAIARSGNTIYLGGTFRYVGPRNASNGAVLNQSDGKLAQTPPLKIDGMVLASAADGQGGWYIGGYFTQVQGVERKNLAHINSLGKLDLAWNPAPNSTVLTLAIANNVVYVGGEFTHIGGQPRNKLAALNAVTGQATVWNAEVAGTGNVSTLFIANSTVYAAGGFNSVGGQPRSSLAAIDATTGLVTSWNPGFISNVYALAVSNNRVFVGGYFNKIGDVARNGLAALDATTGQVTSWNPGSNNDIVIHRLLISDNIIYVSGGFSSIGGQVRNNLAALDAVTGQATTWDANLNAFGDIYSIALAEQKIFVSGNFNQIGGQSRANIAALDVTTGQATSWNPVLSPGANLQTLSVTDKSIFVGGTFSSVGGVIRNRLAALDVTTGQATSWNPVADSFVYALAVSGSTVYAGGSFLSVGGQPRNYLAAIDGVTGTVSSWNPNADRDVRTMAISDNTLYVGGAFTNVGGQARNSLVALSTATGLATSWNPNPITFTEINAIAISNNQVFVAGNFTNIGGQARKYVAALDHMSGLATSWNPSPDQAVSTLAATESIIYVGGDFTTIGGQNRKYLAALNPTSGQATLWNPNPNAKIGKVAVSNNTVYTGGYFTSIGGQGRNYLAGLDATSGQATSWNANLLTERDTLRLMSLAAYNQSIYLSSYGYGGKLPLFAAFGKEASKTNFIKGMIYEDINGDCVKSPTEKGLPNLVVHAQPGNYFASTDSLGNYTLLVDTGSYTVRQVLPTKGILIQQACPVDASGHTVKFTDLNETVSGKDFGNQIRLAYSLSTSVSSSRRRRCFRNTTTINYQNEGTASADSVKVYLQLPEFVVLVKASAPYQVDRDHHYVFTLGKLTAGGRGSISIEDSVVCNNPDIRGLTQCTKVWITPANPTPPSPNWDRSTIDLKARCQDNGFVRIGMYNTGAGHMADSSAYRVFLDTELAFQGRFRLNKGDSLILRVPVNGKTLRLEADQRPAHPTKKQSNLSIEACGTSGNSTVSKGFVNQLPVDEGESQASVECLPILDSYDPNDKASSPEGVSEEKYMPTDTPLDYTIRFQNTGNDVAYKVSVVDTLSEHLDLSTLQVKAASHPYVFQVSGKGKAVLTWTFNQINLPDSTADLPGSNGYIRFSIKPKENLPEKTRIENVADIFFDYNPPIRTNTTMNTLYDLPTVVSESVKLDKAIVCTNTNLTVQAGANRSFCEQDTVKLQAVAPLVGQGSWKRISGMGNIEKEHNPDSKVTALGYGENIFEWSVPANSCFSDYLRAQVIITRNRRPDQPVISLIGYDSLRSSTAGDTYQWYLEGQKLVANTQRIGVRQQGHYTVQVIKNDCSSNISEPFHYFITSLEEPVGDRWSVYPNPHTGYFTVKLPVGVGMVREISVLDPLGRTVHKHRLSQPHSLLEEIDISSFSLGTYFIKVQTAEGTFVKRMAKQ
jgi:hypothetical protein